MKHMIFYLGGLGAVLGAYALLVYRSRWSTGRVKVPPRTAIFTIAPTTVVGLALVFGPVLFPSTQRPSDGDAAPNDPPSLAAPPGESRSALLANGDMAPPLTAQGWVNGAPQPGDNPLTVVDIWALW